MSKKFDQLWKAAFGGPQRQRPQQKQQSDGPQIAPETVALLAKLEGDQDTVRSTLQLAAQANPLLGFWALAYACRIVKDIELRKYLIETLGPLGRYPDLHEHVTMILWDLAGRETSPEMFVAIERAWDSSETSSRDIVRSLGIVVDPELENYLLKSEDVDSRPVGSQSRPDRHRPTAREVRMDEDLVAAALDPSSIMPSVPDQALEKKGQRKGTSARRGSKRSKKQPVLAPFNSESDRSSDAFAGSLTNSEAGQQHQLRVD